MTKYITVVEVTATKMLENKRITWDGGSFVAKQGEWLVEGDGYGPCTFSDDEFHRQFTPLNNSSCEEKIRWLADRMKGGA